MIKEKCYLCGEKEGNNKVYLEGLKNVCDDCLKEVTGEEAKMDWAEKFEVIRWID